MMLHGNTITNADNPFFLKLTVNFTDNVLISLVLLVRLVLGRCLSRVVKLDLYQQRYGWNGALGGGNTTVWHG
ncbi:hypothetical protein [Xenorhabdus anantnagensis]|uniref:Uncharacterized protein n=1 Tax=Xenorhabdus anantnagensis TaxID=3025875 RepID=A0ABT5LWF6_9GAMM|nr:hypothetical protein [Xenorhabdus anantnagensis]MDC9598056.1 hypothetical protein [Xenorhabdus anantnagensis]